MERESEFRKIHGGEINLCVHDFQVYYFNENLTISIALGNNLHTFSENFNFHCNLTNIEIELLERLMTSIDLVYSTPSIENSKAWSLS